MFQKEEKEKYRTKSDWIQKDVSSSENNLCHMAKTEYDWMVFLLNF